MANISLQGHQQTTTASACTNEAYYGATTTYQPQQQQQQQYSGASYYNNCASSTSQQTGTCTGVYWNGQSNGYTTNNQSAGYYNTGSSASTYQRSHWNNTHQRQSNSEYYGQQHQMAVASGNRSTAKRAYPASAAPLHDITNNQYPVAEQQAKRRRVATINAHSGGAFHNGVCRKPSISASVPYSTDPTQKVRIESIFRHVELLAQSYWQTSGPTTASTLKPATVEALECTV